MEPDQDEQPRGDDMGGAHRKALLSLIDGHASLHDLIPMHRLGSIHSRQRR
jgi:hypothetical protein